MSESSCIRNRENVPMTFEEWKQKNYKMWNTEQAYMLACEGTPEEETAVDKYSKMIFEAAQPKWTLCKDGMPTEKDGKFEGTGIFNSSVFNVLHSNGTVSSLYYYIKLKAFGTSDGVKVYTYNDIIAWMPLPEAPAEINSGFNKQGANI